MSQLIRGRGDHLGFSIDPKNVNLIEGVKILLQVKFRSIQFSSFRGAVENVSANSGGHLGSPIGPKTQTW